MPHLQTYKLYLHATLTNLQTYKLTNCTCELCFKRLFKHRSPSIRDPVEMPAEDSGKEIEQEHNLFEVWRRVLTGVYNNVSKNTQSSLMMRFFEYKRV